MANQKIKKTLLMNESVTDKFVIVNKVTNNPKLETYRGKKGFSLTSAAIFNSKEDAENYLMFEMYDSKRKNLVVKSTNSYKYDYNTGVVLVENISTTPKKRTDRINETRVMNNGLKCTIINYRSNNDIDVRFENNEVSTNKSYQAFKNGRIALPSERSSFEARVERKGEVRLMSNGMEAKIIGYRNNKDIDIQFENGEIVYGTSYGLFNRRHIALPSSKVKKEIHYYNGTVIKY